MKFDFILGEYYDVYHKSDSNKEIFQARFLGGKYPEIFIDKNNNKYKIYELIYVKSDNDEISL